MQLKIAVVWIALGIATFVNLAQENAEAIQLLEREEYDDLHYVNFKEFFRRMLNVSQVLASIHVKEYLDCAIECLDNMKCFSFNFAISDNNSRSHLCHLLAVDMYSHSSSFVRSDDFHHYALPSPCESFPCQNGGTCRPLHKENHYECNCLFGYNGTHCGTGDACKAVDPRARMDCGWPGINMTTCQNRKCCWDNTYHGFATKWCFYPSDSKCYGIIPKDRVDCGYFGIQRDECEKDRACCFDDEVPDVPHCFKGKDKLS